MPMDHIRMLHKHVARRQVLENRADSSACSNFYLSPTMGQIVNSLDPLPITWNSTCLSTPSIDIYLYSPGADLPRIHVWEGVALSRGTYNATLMPRWWNSTSSQNLQVSIVPSGVPPFLSSFPGGPVFIATYTAPASGTPPSADTSVVSSGITQVDDSANAKKALTPGKKTAAVLLPLIFIALCVAAYIKIKRNKAKEERRRWTEAVDKRMSTISSDWKSVSAAGANAAIRNSIAVGSLRTSSTFAMEGELNNEKRSMSQLRTGVGLRHPVASISSERVSRVSFAPDPRITRASFADSRPSGESRRTRAFHSAYVPPVPSSLADDSDSGLISPRQSQGPLSLTPEDIRAKIHSRSMSNSASGLDEVLPALRMMRTGSDPSAPDDFLFVAPNPPEPAYPKPDPASQQFVNPIMPMEPMPANVMSPDEMLRAYAERKKSIAAPPKPLTPRRSIVKKLSMISKHRRTGSNTMRVLYNATTGSLSSTDRSSDASHSVYGAVHGQSTGHQSMSQSESSITEEHDVAVGYAIGDQEDDLGVVGRGSEVG